MCKHLRSEHHKGILGSVNECKNCQCSDFMRCDKPLKSDVFCFILGIVVIGIFITLPVIIYFGVNELSQEELDQPYEITNGEMFEILLLILILGVVIGGLIYYDLMIGDYLYQRKRRKHSES